MYMHMYMYMYMYVCIHTHVYKHSLLSFLSLAHMCMCLGLIALDWVTCQGLVPEENGFSLSWEPLIACGS